MSTDKLQNEKLEKIAKKYCKEHGYKFLSLNDDGLSFAFQIGTGDDAHFVHRNFASIAEETGSEQ